MSCKPCHVGQKSGDLLCLVSTLYLALTSVLLQHLLEARRCTGLMVLLVSQVLEKDPGNVKALFRRAQAYMLTQDYIEARQDLDLAIKSEPSNRSASHASHHLLHKACLHARLLRHRCAQHLLL